MLRFSVTDGVDDPLLDRAVDGEIEQFSVGIGELPFRIDDLSAGVAPTEAGDEFLDQPADAGALDRSLVSIF